MAWLAVNSNGYGSIFDNKPIYEKSDLWSIPSMNFDSKYGIHLSTESIKNLTGKYLTFEESPIFIK